MELPVLLGIAGCLVALCGIAACAFHLCRRAPMSSPAHQLSPGEHSATQATLRVVPDSYKPPQPQAYLPERNVKLQPH